MINATFRFCVTDEEIDNLREVLLTILEPTYALPGCIGCRLYQEEQKPGNWLLLESWTSMDAMKRHIESTYFLRILEAMELASYAPEVAFDSIEKTEGFELIEELRK